MKRHLLTALALIALALPARATEDVDTLLASLQRRYASAASVHAKFRQVATTVSLGDVTDASGECWFAKPGKMRWVYETPEPQTLVSDGTTLWFHQPTRYQVTVTDVPPELSARIPTGFFSGTGNLTETYDATLVEPEADDATSESTLVDLVPKDQETPSPFRKLRIRIDDATGLVTRIAIHDPFGNVNRLDFSDIELLETVDDSLFTFQVPEGTVVVQP